MNNKKVEYKGKVYTVTDPGILVYSKVNFTSSLSIKNTYNC